MNETFSTIAKVIRQRRTVKPPQMNGLQVPDEQIQAILELANWAPTHGLTEPWRFRVYGGSQVQEFCQQHADLYRDSVEPEKFSEVTYTKLQHMGDQASHVLIAIMQRGPLPKVPALEEIAATSCAIQNILLGATALGIASYWGSGGMTHHPALKSFLHLHEDDIVMGILYLGYSEFPLSGKRSIPMEEKVTWK